MDFGALPPEVNSGRMYSGIGSGSMLAAAAAWDGLASELTTTASSYRSVIDGLTSGPWLGPTSASMAAAVTPYMTWMNASGMQAEQTASQAKAAAAAYEAAFAATVPPPVIDANRSLLATLVATNFLGQNTPAIAATESHYAEMWAQDAGAMYGYAGSSAAASEVTPFSQPPSTTNPASSASQGGALAHSTGTAAGSNAQSVISQLMSTTPQALNGLSTPASTAATSAQSGSSSIASGINSAISGITGSLSPASLFTVAGVPFLLAIQSVLLPMNAGNLLGALAKSGGGPAAGSGSMLASELATGGGQALGAGAGGSTLGAGMGNATAVGSLSVPQSWATAAPAVRPVAAVFPSSGTGAAPAAAAAAATEGESAMFSELALSNLAGRAMAGAGGAPSRSAHAGGGMPVGVPAGGEATTATIIVIPPDD